MKAGHRTHRGALDSASIDSPTDVVAGAAGGVTIVAQLGQICTALLMFAPHHGHGCLR
jgi:hypothetical protein